MDRSQCWMPTFQYRYNALGQRVWISNVQGRTRHLIYAAAGHSLEEVILWQNGSFERLINSSCSMTCRWRRFRRSTEMPA